MTQTEKLCKANRWRVGRANAWDGVFLVPIDGELWQVALVEEDGERRRLVVGHAQRTGVMPTHPVMTQLRNLFFSDEAMVVQVYTENPAHYTQTLYELPRQYPILWPDETL